MLGKAILIGVDGTHCSGKTTLALQLCAGLKELHVHAAFLPDVTRESVLILEDFHQPPDNNLGTQLHLAAKQITRELEYSRQYDLVVCDKTMIGILAYSDLLVSTEKLGKDDLAVYQALCQLCRRYARYYDLILKTTSLFDMSKTADSLRLGDRTFQEQVDRAITSVTESLPVKSVPLTGATGAERLEMALAAVMPLVDDLLRKKST